MIEADVFKLMKQNHLEMFEKLYCYILTFNLKFIVILIIQI